MLVALGGSALGTLAFALAVIRPEPWWSPRYAIPLLGMLLGNSLSAVSLALDSLLKSLRGGLPLLAFGATRAEATQGAVAAALQTGTTSIVNTLNVVGLVTIPGMMTGQVLGGAAPPKAASYQVLILVLILCTTFLAALGASLLATRAAFDGRDRFLRRQCGTRSLFDVRPRPRCIPRGMSRCRGRRRGRRRS